MPGEDAEESVDGGGCLVGLFEGGEEEGVELGLVDGGVCGCVIAQGVKRLGDVLQDVWVLVAVAWEGQTYLIGECLENSSCGVIL